MAKDASMRSQESRYWTFVGPDVPSERIVWPAVLRYAVWRRSAADGLLHGYVELTRQVSAFWLKKIPEPACHFSYVPWREGRDEGRATVTAAADADDESWEYGKWVTVTRPRKTTAAGSSGSCNNDDAASVASTAACSERFLAAAAAMAPSHNVVRRLGVAKRGPTTAKPLALLDVSDPAPLVERLTDKQLELLLRRPLLTVSELLPELLWYSSSSSSSSPAPPTNVEHALRATLLAFERIFDRARDRGIVTWKDEYAFRDVVRIFEAGEAVRISRYTPTFARVMDDVDVDDVDADGVRIAPKDYVEVLADTLGDLARRTAPGYQPLRGSRASAALYGRLRSVDDIVTQASI